MKQDLKIKDLVLQVFTLIVWFLSQVCFKQSHTNLISLSPPAVLCQCDCLPSAKILGVVDDEVSLIHILSVTLGIVSNSKV